MKLYATVRASKLVNGELITVQKGQGSNYSITAEMTVQIPQDAPILYTICLTDELLDIYSNGKLEKRIKHTKGKREKDECPHNYCDDKATCLNCGEPQ